MEPYRPIVIEVIAALLVALASASASAQIVRCQDNVYRQASDCPGAQKSGAISQPYQATTPKPVKADETPPECKFRYFVLGDEKGKVLASNAKQECIRNKALKDSGRASAVTYDAYKLWKDNFEIESTRRNQALDRSNAANAANATANRPKLRMTCKPDYLGRLQCEEGR